MSWDGFLYVFISNSFRLPTYLHMLVFQIFVFRSLFVVVLFRRFYVSFVSRFSTTGVYLWYNVHNTETHVDTLRKARPSPSSWKGHVFAYAASRSGPGHTLRYVGDFSTLPLQPTTPGTCWRTCVGAPINAIIYVLTTFLLRLRAPDGWVNCRTSIGLLRLWLILLHLPRKMLQQTNASLIDREITQANGATARHRIK